MPAARDRGAFESSGRELDRVQHDGGLTLLGAWGVLLYHAHAAHAGLADTTVIGAGFLFTVTLLIVGSLIHGLAAALHASQALADRRASAAQSVSEVSTAALQLSSLDRVRQDVAATARDLLGVEIVAVLDLATNGQLLTVAAMTDAGGPITISGLEVPVCARTQAGVAVRDERPVVCEDIRHDDRFDAHPLLLAAGILSAAVVPVFCAGEVRGVISVWHRTRRTFSGDDLTNLTALAGVLGAARAQRQVRAELEHQARHDPLTGLGNRTLFLEQLHAGLARSIRTGGDLRARVTRRLALESELRHGLELGAVSVAYQPIVLKTAITDTMVWRSWHPELTIAVNVSPRQLRDDRLVDRIDTALERAGLPASALHLEITETVLFEPDDTSRANLDAAHRRGISLALDDFGTGFSSMTRLIELPLSIVKVDKSFSQDARILQAVAALAHSLHLDTIAEGIETPVQRQLVASLGYTQAQGYLWSQPVPASAVPELLHHSLRQHPVR